MLPVERDVGALADTHFSPGFQRNATALGASPRMRFDVVLNNLAGLAWTTKQIRMTSELLRAYLVPAGALGSRSRY
jgi:hypothetical protein